MGIAMGMDKQRLSSLSRFQKSGRSRWRVQWQVYDKPDGAARSVGRDAAGPQPEYISQFFPPAPAVAIYRDEISEMISNLRFQISNGWNIETGIWNF